MNTKTIIEALSKWIYQDQSFQRVKSYTELTGKPGETVLRARRNEPIKPKAKRQFKQKEAKLEYNDD